VLQLTEKQPPNGDGKNGLESCIYYVGDSMRPLVLRMVRKNEHYVKECTPEKGERQPGQQLPTGYIPFYFFLKALFECHNAVPVLNVRAKLSRQL
jgi:hypothetical protein